MLQHPAFTRLGWGSDDYDDPGDDGGTGSGEQVDVRNLASDDNPLPTQSTIEKQEPASDGGATRAEDAKPSHADDAVVDERVSTGAPSGLPEVRADAESPNAKLADDADSSLDRTGVSGSTDKSLRDEETGPEADLAISVSGADDPSERQGAADHPGEEAFDVVLGDETLGERIDRWDASRLNLSGSRSTDSVEPVSEADQRSADESSAVAYIAAAKEQKPWLVPAADCEPSVQSIYASLDQGSGHAHIRHGPALDQQALARRVARLEDPAQLDDSLREEGVDGLDPTKMHRCGPYATTIVDARAFAAAIAVLSERPDVQDALASDWDGLNPLRLVIPIADVLGEQGHEYCLGVQLAGDPKEAQEGRKQWMQAKVDGADLSALPEPRVERIPTFEGGDLFVIFKRNFAASKFEINTIYPNPARPESE
jgi:hypothetical protein